MDAKAISFLFFNVSQIKPKWGSPGTLGEEEVVGLLQSDTHCPLMLLGPALAQNPGTPAQVA